MPGRYRFSMPSSRDRTDPWFRLGSIDVTSTIIVAFLCVVSYFVYAANPAALLHIDLFPFDVKRGQVWRLVTWPLSNQPDIWGAISIAIFWYLGSQIEARLGRVRYLWLLLLITVGPGALATALNVGVAGVRWIEIPIFVVFVCENPRARFFFGVQAWVLALVIVGIDILQLIGGRSAEVLLVYISSIVIGVLAARSFGMLDELPWVPRIKMRKRPNRRRVEPTPSFTKNKGGRPVVVEGPWPTTPVYKPMQDQAEVDQILDKIALVGMDGLTSDEKRRLNEASKRLRKQGN